jgi:hypothetical protein
MYVLVVSGLSCPASFLERICVSADAVALPGLGDERRMEAGEGFGGDALREQECTLTPT